MPDRRLGRLLIVDDEVELANALRDSLTSQGYETVVCTSGEEAVEALKESNFDLLLTDLMMPGMDGIELLRTALEVDPYLVGILMTGQGTVQTAVEAMKIGALDYVLKPFNWEVLLPILARAMEVRRLRMENVQLRETVAIYELGQTIAHTMDVNTIVHKTVDAALQQLEADEGSLMLPTKDGNELYVAAVRGKDRERLLGMRVSIQEGIAGWVARHREPLTLHGTVNHSSFAPLFPRPDIVSAVSMPLLAGGKLVGVLNINAVNRRPFTLGQVKGVSILASTAAAALEGAKLYAKARRAEEKFRTIFENVMEGVFQSTVDPAGRFLVANSALARMTGYDSPADLMTSVTDISDQLYIDADRRAEFLRLMEKQGFVIGFESKVRRKDGSIIWICESTRAVKDEHGRTLYYEGTCEDVTERVQADEVRRRQYESIRLLNHITRAIAERQDLESIFRVVMEHLEEHLPMDYSGIYLYEPHTNTLTVAASGPKNLSFAAEMGVPEGLSILAASTPMEACIHCETIHVNDIKQIGGRHEQELEKLGIRSLVATPLTVDSEILGVLVAARSEVNAFSAEEVQFLKALSEHASLAAHHARLYERLQTAYEELRQTQQSMMQQERLRALGQMASGIVHDINNTLGPILGYADMLLEFETDLSDQVKAQLQSIKTAAGDITHIVARMREFYRKREEQEPQLPLDLNGLVLQVADLTSPRWKDMPQQRGIVIDVRTDLQEDLPRVSGNETEIRETLINLVFNAADAMAESGTITLRTYSLCHPLFPRQTILEVEDTGTGMDEKTRRRCLEPFFSTKGEAGTGLGLAMVYGVMQRHEGKIEVESQLGRGTTMRLLFPATEDYSPVVPRSEPLTVTPPPPLKILHIDDDPSMRKLVKQMLESDGHSVEVADGGHAGLEAFHCAEERSEPFDLVITDLGMPHVDGNEVTRRVKKRSPSTPVILLTGWGARSRMECAPPAAVDYVLEKPPTVRGIRDAVQRAIMKVGG